MSPHRQLSQSSNRKPSSVQDIFVGFASSLAPADPNDPSKPRNLEYACVLNDGTGVISSETYNFEFTVKEDEKEAREETARFGSEVLALLRSVQTQQGMNVRNAQRGKPATSRMLMAGPIGGCRGAGTGGAEGEERGGLLLHRVAAC